MNVLKWIIAACLTSIAMTANTEGWQLTNTLLQSITSNISLNITTEMTVNNLTVTNVSIELYNLTMTDNLCEIQPIHNITYTKDPTINKTIILNISNINYQFGNCINMPQWYGNQSSIQAMYDHGYSYFNISWIYDNLSYIYIETNYSGINTNYTMTQYNHSLFQYTANVNAGYSYWKSYIRDLNGNENSTDIWYFNVSNSDNVYLSNISEGISWARLQY